MFPTDNATNYIVVVRWLYYVDTLKRELIGTNAYKLQASLSGKVVPDGHAMAAQTALNLGVNAKEDRNKAPVLYWLPKLHKTFIKGLLQILILVEHQKVLNY